MAKAKITESKEKAKKASKTSKEKKTLIIVESPHKATTIEEFINSYNMYLHLHLLLSKLNLIQCLKLFLHFY